MSGHNVTVLEFDSKSRVWQGLGNDALHLNGFFFRQGLQVSVSKKPANCAEMDGLMQCGIPPIAQRVSYGNCFARPVRQGAWRLAQILKRCRELAARDSLGANAQQVL